MTEQQNERRRYHRRQIEALFESKPDDRRRFNYERRGRTLEESPPVLTRAQQVFGERRHYPKER